MKIRKRIWWIQWLKYKGLLSLFCNKILMKQCHVLNEMLHVLKDQQVYNGNSQTSTNINTVRNRKSEWKQKSKSLKIIYSNKGHQYERNFLSLLFVTFREHSLFHFTELEESISSQLTEKLTSRRMGWCLISELAAKIRFSRLSVMVRFPNNVQEESARTTWIFKWMEHLNRLYILS